MRTTFMHGLLKLRDESSVRINHLISICNDAARGISCGSGFSGCTGMSKAVDRMRMAFMHVLLKLLDESSVRIDHLMAICRTAGLFFFAGGCSICVQRFFDGMTTTFMHGFLKLRDESSVRINHLIGICYGACGIFCVSSLSGGMLRTLAG